MPSSLSELFKDLDDAVGLAEDLQKKQDDAQAAYSAAAAAYGQAADQVRGLQEQLKNRLGMFEDSRVRQGA